MIERTLTIINRLGLHARASAKFVQTASRYQAEVRVAKDGRQVSGKSIMGVMMLAAARGSRIHIQADGEDAQAALDALEALIGDRFEEDE